jgi:methionyl-tRNA synthetase
MASVQKFYATTPIYYVNGQPHLGHAYTNVATDVAVRWQALRGQETFLLTGTDENTQKLIKVAEREQTTPLAIADRYAARFQELAAQLNLRNDEFIRTTDEVKHHPGATELWNRLAKADLFYKGTYEGLYCVECEQYYSEEELVEGKCPIHGIELQQMKEENYFFKLSGFRDQLRTLIESNEYAIEPATRRNEVLAFLDGELHDISFSRPSEKLELGVPVPGDESQKMYVWCDALANYVSGIGFGRDEATFEKWWPADLHVIGKDIWKFHAIYWPAMLLGAGLPLPKKLYIHGFFTIDGAKMSKSKGNVIDPFELIEERGTDAVRYYLLRAMPHAGDGDYSERRFSEVFKSELANDFGNLAGRVTALIAKNCDGKVPEGKGDATLMEHVGQAHHELNQLFEDCKFAEAMERLNALVSLTNKRIEQQKPWELTGAEQQTELYNLAQVLGHLALLYQPVLPEKAGELLQRLGLSADGWNPKSLLEWEKLPAGQPVASGAPLFPK